MKKRSSRSVLDLLSRQASTSQTVERFECPACGTVLRLNELNRHLDSACSSSNNEAERRDEKITFDWSKESGERIKGLANGLGTMRGRGRPVGKKRRTDDDSSENSKRAVVVVVESDDEEDEIAKTEKRNLSSESPLPYYLENFLFILDSVLTSDERNLFNGDDMVAIDSLKSLSLSAQKLYVRLFTRSYRWLRVQKLMYPEISKDLEPVGKELIRASLAQSDDFLCDLDVVLSMLSGSEVKQLAKTMHLDVRSGSSKADCIAAFLRLGTQQKSILSYAALGCRPRENETKSIILKRAKEVLGASLRIDLRKKSVLERVLLLFSLPTILDDDEQAAIGKTELYGLLQVNLGEVVYPGYVVSKSTLVFSSREDLIEYAEALRCEREFLGTIEKGNLEKSQEICQSSQTMLDICLTKSKAPTPPSFLLCYTSGWVHTRILWRGVEILQRLRNYVDAVRLLERLLAQTIYCPAKRGAWWDRLTLNLDQHLKNRTRSIDAIARGLADANTRTGHRLALIDRARKICQSNAEFRARLVDFPLPYERKAKVVELVGSVLPESVTGERTVYVSDDGVLSSVELLALKCYREREGWEKGLHAEGSSLGTLFALLMWDVIFSGGIDDVFRSKYQASPLDFGTDEFYKNRKELIDSRLEEVQRADSETLRGMIGSVWDSHYGQQCVGLHWDLFENGKQDAQDLACCMGGSVLSCVCGRLAKDYRHCRGGVPDLTLWSPLRNDCKFAEVKSPTDRLSTKQILWIDFLTRHGAKAEVCKMKK